jgi:methionyl-tRNA formyltransferase
MKIIFMGTPDFAVGTLDALVEAGHEIVLAVTQPDKPKGRGKEMQFPPIKEAAIRHNIPIFQPKKVRQPECIDELRNYPADVMVVVAFGQILPKEILEMTPYGCINVHASLLPKYRGAAPIQWALLSGEQETGVTTMQMDEGLDTGDMILKTIVPIDAKETGESLHDKMAVAGAKLCVETLKVLQNGTATFEKQGETPTPYAKMLKKEMGCIDWTRSAAEIERWIRGMNSWPGAYTHWGDKVLKIWDASVVEEYEEQGIQVGEVICVTKEYFYVQTGDGVLAILSVQLPGKKKMAVDAFLRGNALEKGTLFTPTAGIQPFV